MTPHPPALAALALAVALAPPALAAPPKPVVTGAWSRPTAGAASMGVVYLTVRNPGPADRLTGAASPLARAAELHRSEMAGGMMHMAPEGPLPVPANGELKLAPGGLHLMLVGLKRPLRLGETAPVTLTFEHAGAVAVLARVQSQAPR